MLTLAYDKTDVLKVVDGVVKERIPRALITDAFVSRSFLTYKINFILKESSKQINMVDRLITISLNSRNSFDLSLKSLEQIMSVRKGRIHG